MLFLAVRIDKLDRPRDAVRDIDVVRSLHCEAQGFELVLRRDILSVFANQNAYKVEG